MNIEIRKTQFTNKGAELMLHAILQNIHKNINDAKIVMAPRPKLNPYNKYSVLGIYPKAWLQYKGVQFGGLAGIIPKKLRALYGIVMDSEVDVVLDAGGFEYTDFWGDHITAELANSCKKWKKQGTKIILLPQAFGPFTSNKIRNSIKTVVEYADLIFSRDQRSYKHLVEVAGESDNIRIAPDFTNLVKGRMPNDFDSESNRFCIIPNYRMVDKTSDGVSSEYVPFMKKIVEYLYENGQKPYLLIHEGEKDYNLARNIVGKLENKVSIIKEGNPLGIKGIIGTAEYVISSRFHGLVSGLSQGVPSLGTGWSHKYKMLFEEYQFEEGLLDLNADFSESQKILDNILRADKRKIISDNLKNRSLELLKETELMWQEVYNVIKT